MKSTLYVLLFTVFMAVTSFTSLSCSSNSDDMHQADSTIVVIAQQDGQALQHSHNLEADILRLRGREQRLRDSGMSATADLYIRTLDPYVKRACDEAAEARK